MKKNLFVFTCIPLLILSADIEDFNKVKDNKSTQVVAGKKVKANSAKSKPRTGELVLPLSEKNETEAKDGEDLYILPEFVVTEEKDTGYYSASTTGVTRANTEIKNTPITITVINQELMEDLNILTEEDLVMISPSIEKLEKNDQANRLSIRSFNSSSARYDQFVRSLQRDNYNVRRIDIIRGTNSLIYGQAEPGGRINFVPLSPEFGKSFKRVISSYGNKDYRRVAVDVNQIINDDWAVRLMGLHHEQAFEQTFKSREFDGVTLEAAFRPTRETEIKIHLEKVDALSRLQTRFMNNDMGLDATQIMKSFPFAPEAIDLIPQDVKDIIDNDPTNKILGVTTDTFREIFSKIAKNDFGSYEGPDEAKYTNGLFNTFQFTKVLSDQLQFQLGFNYQTIQSNNLDRNAAWGVRMLDPKQTADMDPYLLMNFTKNVSSTDMLGVRSTAIYNTEFFKGKHTVLLGFDLDSLKWETDTYAQAYQDRINDNGSFKVTNKNAGDSTYAFDIVALSDGVNGPYSRFDSYGSNPHVIGAYTGNNYIGIYYNGVYPDGKKAKFALTDQQQFEQLLSAGWGAVQSQFFGGKLRTLAGFRYEYLSVDHSRLKVINQGIDGDAIQQEDTFSSLSTNLGALYWISDSFGIFGSFSESMLPPNARLRTVFGDIPKPSLSRGLEAGLRFSLLENKINGQFVAYTIEKDNIMLSFSNWNLKQMFPKGEYSNLYEKATNDFLPTVGNQLNGVKYRSEGLEFECFYNPSRSLTFNCGYAYSNYDRTELPDIVTNASKVSLSSEVLGFAHHQARATVKYTFGNKTPLKGFSIGLNQAYRSESTSFELTKKNTTVGELRFPAEFNTNVFVNYRNSIGSGRKAPVLTMSLRVNNILDDESLINRGASEFYKESRTVILTGTLRF